MYICSAKVEAWQSLGLMGRNQAIQEYLTLVRSVAPNFKQDLIALKKAQNSTNGGGPAVSSNDKTVFEHSSDNNIGQVRRLLESKVNVNEVDEDRRTALHWACDRGHSDMVHTYLPTSIPLPSHLHIYTYSSA